MMQRLFVPIGMSFVLLLHSAGAASAPAFCPSSSGAACGGRNVGDLLITLHGSPPLILGLQPSTREYYIFSSALADTSPLASELGDIAVVPSNPLHVVVIGDTDNGSIGIRELDDCGGLVSQVFGSFPTQLDPPLPPISHYGFNDRGMVFSPVTGNLLSPGTITNYLDGSGPVGVFFSFPPTGGSASVLAASGDLIDAVTQGAVAADALGNVYLGHSLGSEISVMRNSGIEEGAPIETSLSSGVSNIADMVDDGDGHLFVAGNDSSSHGIIWRVDERTGLSTLWTSDRGPNFGGDPFNQLFNITIDAYGNLWAVETWSDATSRAGVVEISGEDGGVLDYFQMPETVGGFPAATNRPQGIAVLGVNLPAVRQSCASACAAYEITDCSGDCVPAWWLGNGYCNEPGGNFACWSRGFDYGGCNPCGANEVPDCNGNCAPVAWIGDSICDAGEIISNYGGNLVSFNCQAFRFDETTCGPDCGSGARIDCNGNCAPRSWLGDTVCDNASVDYVGNLVQYDCVEYEFDHNDCH